MNKRLKKKWTTALRSGEYEQGVTQLRNNQNQFCCLGVLCDVQGRKWRKDKYGEWAIGEGLEMDAGGEENDKLRADVGDKHLGKLIRMNDDGWSFSDIADYIEKNL